MRRLLGGVLIVLGVVFTLGAALQVQSAPNVSYLIGMFMPGFFLLIVGLAVGKSRQPLSPAAAVSYPNLARPVAQKKNSLADSLKSSANLGIVGGIILMFIGSAGSQGSENELLVGAFISLLGWAWLVWGCVRYMEWKGYSGWFGLFGFLLLPGLLILICFPNKRKGILLEYASEDIPEVERYPEDYGRPWYLFVLALLPLGVPIVILCSALLLHLSLSPISTFGLILGICLSAISIAIAFRKVMSVSSRGMASTILCGVGFVGSVFPIVDLFTQRSSEIDPAEWRQFAPSGVGFQVLMPGTPQQAQKTQETAAGKIELHKFMVEPKGKKELFMIVSIRFPEAAGEQFGGPKELLELGRKDLLVASQGQLKSERRIVLGDSPGLELEVLPPMGAIIKSRIFATKNQLFQVSVHVPKIRVSSPDVQKFLDSFKFSQAGDS